MGQFWDSWYSYQFRYCSVSNPGLFILAKNLPALLLPRFPDIRLISKSGLFSITNHRCLNHLRVFQYLLKFIFLCNILNERKQILILALPVDHIFQSTICLGDRIEFTLTQSRLPARSVRSTSSTGRHSPFFFHINKLKLDPTFFKETFCFLCIIALLCSKNLYIQINSPCPSPYVSFLQKTL